jgi:phosphoenolpyruvate synthase/pyruvate phosphate dikinase
VTSFITSKGDALEAQVYGGKGAALLHARSVGLPVPRLVCIPIAGFRSGEELAVIRRDLKAPYAVRSSAPHEDGRGGSFAGMYDSVINVPADGLEDAIRQVELSAVRVALSRYRNVVGAPPNPSMAVVVQEFIDADVSGVMLWSEDLVHVEAVQGLGEAICQGLVDPDAYVFNGQTKELKEQTVGSQPFYIRGAAAGGTEQVPCVRTGALLGHAEVYDLAFIGYRCRIAFYEWVDRRLNIEWCMRDGKIYLLQVRPEKI